MGSITRAAALRRRLTRFLGRGISRESLDDDDDGPVRLVFLSASGRPNNVKSERILERFSSSGTHELEYCVCDLLSYRTRTHVREIHTTSSQRSTWTRWANDNDFQTFQDIRLKYSSTVQMVNHRYKFHFRYIQNKYRIKWLNKNINKYTKQKQSIKDIERIWK